MKKVPCFYARVSTEEQAEKGNVEGQINFGKKYFDLHGISEFRTYIDDGVSGTVALRDRDNAAKMLLDIQKGEISEVYVYRLDRLARSVKHVLDTYELLEGLQIPLKSMTESFDTGTPTGKFFMTTLSSIAELERNTILERTSMGKERKAKQGQWTSGPPPYGYRIGTDKKLVIHKEEAAIIRLIFKLYVEGMNTVPLAEYLNAKNKPTPTLSKGSKNKSMGEWHAGHISIILRNTIYIGRYTVNKRSKKNKPTFDIPTPIIIDPEIFKQAQARINENADVARGAKGREYLLRGMIFCENCGRAYVGNSGVSKEGRVYYRCTGAINHGVGKACDSKMVRADQLEGVIWKDIQEFLNDPGMVADALEKTMIAEIQDISPVHLEIEEIDKDIIEKQMGRQSILSLVSKKIISENEAENELVTIAGQIELLNKRKEDLLQRVYSSQERANQIVTVKAMLEEMASGEKDKAHLFKNLVQRVTISTKYDQNGKKITTADIKYVFRSGDGVKQLSRYINPSNICTVWQLFGNARTHEQHIRL